MRLVLMCKATSWGIENLIGSAFDNVLGGSGEKVISPEGNIGPIRCP
jgi:hypothetical protein